MSELRSRLEKKFHEDNKRFQMSDYYTFKLLKYTVLPMA